MRRIFVRRTCQGFYDILWLHSGFSSFLFFALASSSLHKIRQQLYLYTNRAKATIKSDRHNKDPMFSSRCMYTNHHIIIEQPNKQPKNKKAHKTKQFRKKLITYKYKEKQKQVKMVAEAGPGQCEVVLVGCGAPKRGMGWYHGEQLLKGKCPSAKLCFVVEPWFMGAGKWLLLREIRRQVFSLFFFSMTCYWSSWIVVIVF